METPLLLKPTVSPASPSTGAREVQCAACLLTAMGAQRRPSKLHKTEATLGRAARPPRRKGKGSKDRVSGPQSLTPLRSSYWNVSALLQNSTGEGPVPLSRLAPTQEGPLRSKHMGVRGTEPKCGFGQTCKRAQKTNGAEGKGGAEVVQCTTRSCLPSLHQRLGLAVNPSHPGRVQSAWTHIAAQVQVLNPNTAQSPCFLPSQIPRQKPL